MVLLLATELDDRMPSSLIEVLAHDVNIIRTEQAQGHLHPCDVLAFEHGCLAYAQVTRARDAPAALRGDPPAPAPSPHPFPYLSDPVE